MRCAAVLTNAVFQQGQEPPQAVTVPHTWNAFDGQDGGADYYRGCCIYEFALPDPTEGMCQYIEFAGVNHIARVFCNGEPVGRHEGGFSTFRFALTDHLKPHGNTLTVKADNRKSHVYPQRADFTFFGGIYREVRWLEVPPAHFDLLYHGTDGLFLTPKPDGTVEIRVRCKNADGCQILCTVCGDTEAASAEAPAEEETTLQLCVRDPHLWDGIRDPYLYTATVRLMQNGQELDRISSRFGFRSYRIDADQGFFLNGTSLPLRGVCRHQDRQDRGWAISKREHLEDLQLIREVGANTVRLAHYQHDRYFYDLCDEAGLVVWAEIPFISQFMPGQAAKANTLSQMTELILQNYNHPSICFWGIANETTIGKDSPELQENLRELQALCKSLDRTRLTTMAHLASVGADHPHTEITDIHSVNYYFGWYRGHTEENAVYLDAFHAAKPGKPLGLSEYGVDNLTCWHSAHPVNHDYTEEYAVDYHRKMLSIISERPYLWATHTWNMFDFAADQRDEGGIRGRNCKGLITYDRKTKKDAFYVYQAFWTTTPMVHICGKRFRNRAPGERDITVFTNQPQVELILNGQSLGIRQADRHRVIFENVPLSDGENAVTVRAQGADDSAVLCGVSEHDTAYDLPELAENQKAGNWFAESEEPIPLPDGMGYRADDAIGVLLANKACEKLVRGWIMAKEEAPLEQRLLCACRLITYSQDSPLSRLRDKKTTIGAIMTDADFEILDNRLRAIPRKQ